LQPFEPNPEENHVSKPLYPVRRVPELNVEDESLLGIKCYYADTGKPVHTVLYRPRKAVQFDWNDAINIRRLGKWRESIYQTAGMAKETPQPFHPDEDAWMELFYCIVMYKGQQKKAALPSKNEIARLLNAFFKGRVLQDRNGKNLAPRVERGYSVFGRSTRPIFDGLGETDAAKKGLVYPKGHTGTMSSQTMGLVYTPSITDTMLRKFQDEKKKILEKKGGTKEKKRKETRADYFAATMRDLGDLTLFGDLYKELLRMSEAEKAKKENSGDEEEGSEDEEEGPDEEEEGSDNGEENPDEP
jgi:hypothetical protein